MFLRFLLKRIWGFFAEKIPAYLYGFVTGRQVKIDILTTEEYPSWLSVSMLISVKTRVHRSSVCIMRPLPLEQADQVMAFAVVTAIEKIEEMQLPPSMIRVRFKKKVVAIISP